MKKLEYFILITFFIFILTGCETHKEISDLGMVSAVGIEKINDEYYVSVQVANIKKTTNMGTNNTSKVIMYTGIGKTPFEAIREVSNKSSKKLYFPHIKIIILSDEIINDNPKQMIDFFARDNEGNMNAYVLVSVDHTPYEILSTVTAFEDVPAEYIYNSITLSEAIYGNTRTLTFEDFVNFLIKPEIDPSFTKISLSSDEKEKNNTETLNAINLSSYINLGNILVFNKDNELVELSEEESVAFNLIDGKGFNSITTLSCSNNKNNYYTLELMSNSSNIKFNSKKDEMNISLNLTYSISDFNCETSLLDSDNIKKIELEIEERTKNNINSLLNKSIEYQSDFIGFGKLVKSKDKNYFDFKNKNWSKDGLPNLNFKTNVKVSLENRGDLINIVKKEGKYE